ncbi:MAG: Rrf2 family transcriptional regulator [Pseudomonadota bacterium]
MKLSTKGRYAVMAMVELALRGCEDPVTLCDISEQQEISLSYLEQLFSKLRRAGLVRSVRGPGGGYCLARPSAEISVADILFGVDEPIRVTRCRPSSPGGCMQGGAKCLTHDLWAALGDHTYRFLCSVSLEDVVKKRFCPGLAASSPLAVSVGNPALVPTVDSLAAE